LPNLQAEIKTIMEHISTWWKLERDPLYQIGREKGMEKGMEQGKEEKTLEVVKSLLLNTHHTVAEIASLVNVSEDFVRMVKKSLHS